MNPAPIPKRLDLSRTMFLSTEDQTFYRKFKRRRTGVLVDATNTPLRRMAEHREWLEFKKNNPEAVAAGGLRWTIVWVLEEIKA